MMALLETRVQTQGRSGEKLESSEKPAEKRRLRIAWPPPGRRGPHWDRSTQSSHRGSSFQPTLESQVAPRGRGAGVLPEHRAGRAEEPEEELFPKGAQSAFYNRT